MHTSTQAEFARTQNVSRKTVTDWKDRGYLTMVDGRVDVEASNRTLASVGRSRLSPVTLSRRSARVASVSNADRAADIRQGNVSEVRTPASKVTGNAAGPCAVLLRHTRDFPHVLTLATFAGSPSDLVLALLDHLPMATVRPLVEGVVAKERAAAVELTDEDGPPVGYTTWADHPWFTEPPLTEGEWAELETEHRHPGT